MTPDDLIAAARTAGEAGLDYETWAGSDGVHEALHSLPRPRNFGPFESAFRAGRQTYRLANGWKSLWTTAPADYDGFGTQTAEGPFPWNGLPLRRAVADPGFVDWQANRYESGGHGAWNEDPRIEETRRREELARDAQERMERGARRIVGLVWIRTVDLDANEDTLHVELQERALDWRDVATEKKRRRDEKEATERAIVWERCRATFADGVTLIDQGTEGYRGYHGWIPGRPPGVWRNVVVRDHWSGPSGDAKTADVVGEGPLGIVGSLADVAAKLLSGQMRIAGPDEPIAPLAVVKRVGRSFHEIGRVRIGAVTMWVDYSRGKTLVLDEKGHIVRSKKLEAHALASRPERVQLTPLSEKSRDVE